MDAVSSDWQRIFKNGDYSFRFLSFFYHHQYYPVPDSFVLEHLNRVISTDINAYKRNLDYRSVFDAIPGIRKVYIDNDLSGFPLLQDRVNVIKETISNEKEESKVLEESFPSDVLRYIIWNYL